MIYNKPACEIYIFEGKDYEKFEEAAKIYVEEKNMETTKLYEIGYKMLFEKVNEILKKEENR